MKDWDDYVKDLICNLAQLRPEEIMVFGNKNYNDIIQECFKIDWVQEKIKDADSYQNKINLVEPYCFDLKIGNKTYFFLSQYGMNTWQVTIILNIFSAALRMPEDADELMMYNYFKNIDTLIVANFLIFFVGESFGQTIKRPRDYDFICQNERFKDKFEVAGFITEKDEETIYTVYRVLERVIDLSYHTNEGSPIKFNAILFPERSETGFAKLTSLYKEHFPTNLCNTKDSYFKIDSKMNIFEYYSKKEDSEKRKESFFSHPMHCSSAHKEFVEEIKYYNGKNPTECIYGVTLEDDGTIYILTITGVLFYFKNNHWNFSFEPKFRKTIRLNERSSIMLEECSPITNTIYDCIYYHKGCCIGVIPQNTNFPIEKENNVFFDNINVLGNSFHDVQPSLRLELASIDGATILEGSSYIVKGVAQILPIDKSSSEGARTSAAKFIAKKGGIGIKVSEDGYISVYKKTEKDDCDNIIVFGKSLDFSDDA